VVVGPASRRPRAGPAPTSVFIMPSSSPRRDQGHDPTSAASVRLLLETTRAVPWEADATTWRFTYVGPQAADLLGYPADEWLGSDFWVDHLHPEDRERAVEFCERTSRHSPDYEFEYRMIAADGREVWLLDIVSVEYAHGEPVKLRGFLFDISDRKRIEQDLRRMQEELEARRRDELHSMTSELVLAEERGRRRIAEDLHDGLCQILTLAKLKLAGFLESAEVRPDKLLVEVQELLSTANQSARSLTFQISPPVLYDLGFEAGLEWLAENVHESYGLRVEFERDEQPKLLDQRVQVLLFRATRELLINVAKHARSGAAHVRLFREGDSVHVVVEDQGVAFDPAEAGGRGFGLVNIKNRLQHLGGSMRIDTRPGAGTRIELVAPSLPKETPTS